MTSRTTATDGSQSAVARAYENAAQTGQLRAGRLDFLRTIAESVGVQGPTTGAVLTAGILAGVSGGGTALVLTLTAVAMGFVAYAFVLFTRNFNSAGSVYGFTGAVGGPIYGFVSAWTLMLVYASFAGGLYIVSATEARSAFDALGFDLSWPWYAAIASVLVMVVAFFEISISATTILALEGFSMALVVVACIVITVKGGYHGHALSAAPFRPGGVGLSVLALGVVLSFSTFSGFEAAATMGEESSKPERVIPRAIAVSLIIVAVFSIVVAAVVTNAYPNTTQLSLASVPLVTVTDEYVSHWVGTLVNFGGLVSALGAALACVVGASRLLFALGRDTGPAMLRRTSRLTGAPVGALCCVGAAGLVTMLLFIKEPSATRAVAISLSYGAYLIIVVYVFVVLAAILLAIRLRMSLLTTAILLTGFAFLGYIVKETFAPIPAAPFRWAVLAAGVSLLLGIGLPFVYPPLRRAIEGSPLLNVSTRTLLDPDPGAKTNQGQTTEPISPDCARAPGQALLE